VAFTPVNREYETIYVLRPDAAREVTESVAGRVSDAIRAVGTITQIENWGRRKLAYPVSKHKRGLYVYFKYVATGAAVEEVERTLRLQESVMKFQTVKVSDATVGTAAEGLAFEHVEVLEQDEEETLAQTLGLEGSQSFARARDEDEYVDDDDDDDDVIPGRGRPPARPAASPEGDE
jgi:small subunit ribosomal protein S6